MALSGEGNGTPLQHSCLESPMDGGAWWAAVHGVAKSQTRLSGFTFTFHFNAMEKEMATHSSVLALRIPGTGKPGWAAVSGVAQGRIRLKRLSSSSSNGPFPSFSACMAHWICHDYSRCRKASPSALTDINKVLKWARSFSTTRIVLQVLRR